MLGEYTPGEPDTWTWPDAYDRDNDPPADDCLNCGVCEWCIERSAEYARELNDLAQEADMRRIGTAAKEIGAACLNYVSTRFPAGHDVPAHPIDAEWFADAAQKSLDKIGASVAARAVGNAVVIERAGGGFDASFGCASADSAAFVASQINTAIAVVLRDATGDRA